jgi:hypothetical protein
MPPDSLTKGVTKVRASTASANWNDCGVENARARDYRKSLGYSVVAPEQIRTIV